MMKLYLAILICYCFILTIQCVNFANILKSREDFFNSAEGNSTSIGERKKRSSGVSNYETLRDILDYCCCYYFKLIL